MEIRRERLRIDPGKCTGCRRCILACAMKHHGWANPNLTRIKLFRFQRQNLNVPVICLACDDPPCVNVCPVNARIRESNGTVVTDTTGCIGCKTCIYICPVGSPVVNPYTGRTMTCDMCKDDASGPWCVTACQPEGALTISKSDRPAGEAARKRAAVSRSIYPSFDTSSDTSSKKHKRTS